MVAQALLCEEAVEVIDGCALQGLFGPYEFELDTSPVSSRIHRLGEELRPDVYRRHLW